MASLNTIAKEWAYELREGIAWLIVWKNKRHWNAQAVWLNDDDDTLEPEDLELGHKALEQDPNAVILNGYYCGHFAEDMTVAELAAGIRWHYDNGYNKLDGSGVFPDELNQAAPEAVIDNQQDSGTAETDCTDSLKQNEKGITIDFDTLPPFKTEPPQGEKKGEQMIPELDMRAQDLLELYQLSQLFFSTYGDRIPSDSTHSAKAWISLMGERYKAVTGGGDITTASNPRNAGRPTVYTDEQNNRILDLRGEGLSLRRIAEEIPCSLAHVQRVLERQNQ